MAGARQCRITNLLAMFYPSDWAQISRCVRFERTAGLCQGCGRPHGMTVRCLPDGRWFDATPTPRLATLDQLHRVIYARSFSKTLSGSLRVGFVACTQDIANELADIKMLTSITTSPFTERLIYLMLVDGHYRKYLSRLHERLGEARRNVVRAFEQIGLELFAEPADGLFVWALPAYR
jgi:aspartate/methionine/tyrosine aminotransferase